MPTDPTLRPGWTVDPDLATLADTWETVTDPDAPHPVYAMRCGDPACGQLICPPDHQGRLYHLLSSHGYRMDGRSYDNHNRVITTATRELTARADR